MSNQFYTSMEGTMKKIVACLAYIVLTAAVHAEDRLVTLLAQNKAVHRDEIFTFNVTYSDVSIKANELRFTVTMLHKEELGSYKISVKQVLPLNLLKNARREVITNTEIGKNTLVRIYLPENIPPAGIIITTVQNDVDGKAGKEKTETRIANSPYCDIDFPDIKAAQTWNEELTKILNNASSIKEHEVQKGAKSDFTIPVWTYSYNLLLMRLGFYNPLDGILFEAGFVNNIKNERHGDISLNIPTLLQFGMANLGESYVIRGGLVNWNQYDFQDSGFIDLGIVNKGCAWQCGVVGVNTENALQMNLVNSGRRTPQLGVCNLREKSEFSDITFQTGIVNFSPAKNRDIQTGIFNAGKNSEFQTGVINVKFQGSFRGAQWGIFNFSAEDSRTQLGLININTVDYNTSPHIGIFNFGSTKHCLGLLNFYSTFPFVTPLFCK